MNKYELRRMIKDKSGQEDEDTERQNNNTQDSDYDIFRIRDAVRKKTELCGKNSQVADPLPPVWELSHFLIFFCQFRSP